MGVFGSVCKWREWFGFSNGEVTGELDKSIVSEVVARKTAWSRIKREVQKKM